MLLRPLITRCRLREILREKFWGVCNMLWRLLGWELTRPVIAFGHWAKGIKESLVLGSDPATPAEREKQRNAVAQARAARESQLRHQHENARKLANSYWLTAEPSNARHPYLVKKGIDAVGAKLRYGFLLIPLRDDKGQIWNLQQIRADGQKRFLRGGRVKDLYAPVGGPVGEHLIVCEGWATGKSLHTATGLPVAVAFSAGNLLSIAQIMRGKYPVARITLAADNDEKPDGSNPGLTAAKAAAQAVGGYVAIPPIAGDFNDYAAQCGACTLSEATDA
jgi:putative DNA primase/helicase